MISEWPSPCPGIHSLTGGEAVETLQKSPHGDWIQTALVFCNRNSIFAGNIKGLKSSVLRTKFMSPSLAHSYRSATMGSIFVARRAGMKAAKKVVAARTSGTTAKVRASVALTP